MSQAVLNPDLLLRVEASAVEEVRRRVFCVLAGHVTERERSRIAAAIARECRDAGALRSDLEELYPATELAARWHRSVDWVVQTFCVRKAVSRGPAGSKRLERPRSYGPVHRDGGGWLIPASTAQAYLAAHVFGQAAEEVAA